MCAGDLGALLVRFLSISVAEKSPSIGFACMIHERAGSADEEERNPQNYTWMRLVFFTILKKLLPKFPLFILPHFISFFVSSLLWYRFRYDPTGTVKPTWLGVFG
jgi:hypothetical protein